MTPDPFTEVKPSRLTAYCMKLSALAHTNLIEAVENITATNPASVDKRAIVLSQLIMRAAGHFVGESLRWDKQEGMWEGSHQYLRDTNPDVITSEAIIWISFLMNQFWLVDQKERSRGVRASWLRHHLHSGTTRAWDD